MWARLRNGNVQTYKNMVLLVVLYRWETWPSTVRGKAGTEGLYKQGTNNMWTRGTGGERGMVKTAQQISSQCTLLQTPLR
jgi:hypothetical protein